MPINEDREKLIDSLKDGWGNDLTNYEIEIVIVGTDIEAKRVIEKYRLTQQLLMLERPIDAVIV